MRVASFIVTFLLLNYCHISIAVDIYVLGTGFDSRADQPTRLGVISTIDYTYRQITANAGGSSSLTYNLAWIPGTNQFYTINHAYLDGELHTIDTYGNLSTSIGRTNDAAQAVIYGMTYNQTSNKIFAYNWFWNNYGEINNSNGIYSITNAAPNTGGSTTSPPVGGRMTSHAGTTYMTINDADTSFRFVSISETGYFNQIKSDSVFRNLILASDGTNLFGLAPQNSNTALLYDINPTTGSTTLISTITGTNMPNYFVGAAVPEPSPFILSLTGILLAVTARIIKRKK